MTYVAQRLAEIKIDAKGHHKYSQITRIIRDRIRREYFTACTCCGLRPSMADLARRHDVSAMTVWRIVNQEQRRIARKVKRALSSAIEEART
jgi:transposase-like protein